MEQKREIVKFSRSRKPYFIIYLMIIILIVLTTYVRVKGLPSSRITLIGTIVFTIIGMTITEIHRLKDTYKISHEYVEHRSGIISKGEKKIHIKSITDINARQNVFQRLMGYGSIVVQSASGANNIIINNINHPKKFIIILESKKKEIEDKS